MFNVYLKNGETRWIDKHEVRVLQNKGEIICVLEMKENEDGAAENLFFCDIKKGFCDVHSLAMCVRDQAWTGKGTMA